MGVINITQRSETLGNIRSTSMPHGRRDTDIGFVRHTAPRFFGHAVNNQSSFALGGIGEAIGKGIQLALAVKEREDERQADKLTQAVMSNVDRMDRDDRDVSDWNAPDRKHLEGQKRGLLLRTGEGCKTLPEEAESLFDDTFKKIADSMDANDRQRQIAADRLYNYRRARQNRMLDIQAGEYRRMELDGAKAQLDQFHNSWKLGNTGVLEDIFNAQEKLGVLKSHTADRRKADGQNLAITLASELTQNQIDRCASKEEFDELEKTIKDGLEASFPVEIASRLPDGKVGGKVQEAMLESVRRARRGFLAEKEANERAVRQAVGRDFTERELKIRDVPQEMWAQAYEDLGRDETLRAIDPKRAMSYLDAARDLRSAAAKAKEKASADAVKANEEGLSRAYETVELMKLDGSASQDELDEAQAAIWRKFRTLSVGGAVSPSFMHSFESRLSGQLSDQEADAMRKLYRAFGYTGEVNQKGEIPASVRKKDSTTYYAPQPDGADEGDRQKVKASELFGFGDSLLKTLRSLGPDMNREGVVEKEIARLKTEWIRRGFFDPKIKENTDASVRSVMDIQREAQTRRAQQEQNGTRREEDGGRREDDKR